MALAERLRDDATNLVPMMTELRHDLHRHPEIGLQLPRTQRAVLDAIDGLGLEITTGTDCTSVTAVLRGTGRRTGAEPAPVVLLRGDMDALPLQEETGVEFTSTIDGVMHACGHDLHTAMLAGAAQLLSAHRDELPGDVVFMFQPGEEGFDGAGVMLGEGVLDAAGRRVDRAYGMHVIAASVPNRVFTVRPGTMMASSDGLHVTVHGMGGHGSAPHRAKDPVPAAAEMVLALQTMITRRFDIFDPVVVTIGSFHAGTKRNIIPPTASFDATIRTFSPAAREQVAEQAVLLCRSIGAAYGLDVDARFQEEYPVTVNDAAQTAFASGVVEQVFGAERLLAMATPDAGAEDFSRVLEAVPGCYLFLGASPVDDPAAEDNHSPRATFDDGVLGDGCLLHANLAVEALRELTGSDQEG
jgi:amidohydrolase